MQTSTCASFNKLETKAFPQLNERLTAENRFWSKFKSPQVLEKFAPVTHIEFCPTAPFYFAATSSTRIHVHSPENNREIKTFSRFDDIVYSGSFRRDGKLVVAGGKRPIVNVFDMSSRAILRSFKGHTAPIHVTKFAQDNVHIFSASDDKSCRYWDMPTQKAVCVLTGHEDYIRTGCFNPTSPDMWATGSYDHTVSIWDVRNGQGAIQLKHDHPVESCLFSPSGSLLFTASGHTIYVWDIVAGNKLVHSFSNHQKTITGLTMDGTGTRLLSCSLDQHVKVYDVTSNFAVTHGFKYDAGIVSFGISPSNTHLAVGTTNHELIIRERVVATEEENEQEVQEDVIRGGTTRFFLRGQNTKASTDDHVVQVKKQKKTTQYDQALRKFEYKQALDAALETRSPVIMASMLEELKMRGDALTRALSGRDEKTLEPLLSFLIKYVTNPRYAPLLLKVCEIVCDLYIPVLGQSIVIDELFFKLRLRLKQEIQLQKEMLGLVGIMDTIFASPAVK